MPTVPFLDLKAQYRGLAAELLPALQDVCENCTFVLGPRVESFEEHFARYCEAQHCVGVNSGTSALHLALRCLDIGPGDEVITVPMTFVATTCAITYVGATPVFVDIDPATRTLDAARLETAITPRTRAILPVHLYGQPADLTGIFRVAGKYRLPVVEDAAQAHGARHLGRRVGSLGRIGCFSFYPGKNLGAYGEAGALVTNDPELAEKARALRDHGQRQKHCHETVGYNYRMSGFQGAVLDVKLRYLDKWNAARRAHAGRYLAQLAGTPGLGLPIIDEERESVFHLFVVEVADRERIAAELKAAGVETGLHYPVPVHLQPAYAHLRLPAGSFPASERLAQRCLSLPVYPELTDEQIDYTCAQLRAALRGRGASAAGRHTPAAY
jgi:dTDP-4-amino-4,6-dideoxygalactose transaminase